MAMAMCWYAKTGLVGAIHRDAQFAYLNFVNKRRTIVRL